MRLSNRLPLALATAAALVNGPDPALAAADDHATCTGADSGTFPIRTRINGGPASYVAGGGFRTWSLELTNTTTRRCANIHPVIVLADGARTLKRTQPQMEFYEDADSTTSRPVTFEKTDSDELVGVIDEDGDGFSVPPGRTLTVKVRLSVTSDAAVPNDVVAKAAVVERRGDDSEWVGESNDYHFRIVDEEDDGGEGEGEGGGETETETETEPGSAEGAVGGGDRDEGGVRSDGPYASELAGTGVVRGLLPYAIGLLVVSVGGLLVVLARRRAR
ncbi:cell wall protein [Streptomyces ipomoeae]|jgi:hypothetical protein|uniref:LPXTG cell wall anchor domain protein n=3 Tax=Streptomyces ipomoeae TaxID=103232 RepID=L1KL20_9ACTN|nr:hypothetical protein [Streptomyces ipomoeae]EKX61254.1 LPXTG cell wall anchor domain protein [Streptomyces ipomoeae 91-03]MDX2698151.1 cell wall protein [Streptomyces ipomoeae]MDX2826078.1 cell wall protein [Streptomyces ipomoeae]MDX2846113.1 cell wall protein [Streptomyces ipomoeae]MDX2878789.1 cell wall protein [Streptomyces ipomoeae]